MQMNTKADYAARTVNIELHWDPSLCSGWQLPEWKNWRVGSSR